MASSDPLLPPVSPLAQDLLCLLSERILLFDGAMGTSIQDRHPDVAAFGGPDYEGCNEHLVLTAPHLITDIHAGFLEAGSDIIETNTFGATRIVLAEYGLEGAAAEINRAAAEIARQAADRHSTPAKPRFVAGSMGPTTKTISVTGGVTFAEMRGRVCRTGRGTYSRPG